MKNLLFLTAGALVAVFSAALLTLALSGPGSPEDELFEANVEALLNQELDPAVIVCDDGICGSCFVEENAWPFYKCNWTGYQEDYCDCDKIGYL